MKPLTVGELRKLLTGFDADLPIVRTGHFGEGLPYTSKPALSRTWIADHGWQDRRGEPDVAVLVFDAPDRGPEPD